MATRYNYSEETKNQVLAELHNGKPKEEIATEYNVPIPVIEEWERHEKSMSFIDAMFVHDKSQHNHRSIWDKVSSGFYACYNKAKATWLQFALPLIFGGFIFGIVNLQGVANIKGVFNNDMDIAPEIDLGFQLDSLLSVQNEISTKLDKQIEISSEINSNITINNTYNNKPRKRPSKKAVSPTKKDTCQIIVYCNCCNASNDSLR